MNLGTIRDAIGTALETIDKLEVRPRVTDSVNPPVAIVAVGDGSYDDTSDGAATVNFTVAVLVSKGADASYAQELLDEYLDDEGARSVKLAIDADPTLGDVVDSCRVVGWSDYNGTWSAGAVEYAGVELHLEVYA